MYRVSAYIFSAIDSVFSLHAHKQILVNKMHINYHSLIYIIYLLYF